MGFLNFIKKGTTPIVETVNVEEMNIFPDIGYQFSNIRTYKYKPNCDSCYLIEGENLVKARNDLKK